MSWAASSADTATRTSWPRAFRCLDTIVASVRSSSIIRTLALATPLFIDRPHDQVAARVFGPGERLEGNALRLSFQAEGPGHLLPELQAGESYPRGRSGRNQRDRAFDFGDLRGQPTPGFLRVRSRGRMSCFAFHVTRIGTPSKRQRGSAVVESLNAV